MPPNKKESLAMLLHRKPDDSYIEELTQIYSEKIEVIDNQSFSPFFVFRLGEEWFALLSDVVREVVMPKTIHAIPHKSNEMLLGTVNISGQFKLLVSLEKVLNIQNKEKETSEKFIVISYEQIEWVIKTPEILGIRKLNLNHMKNVPVTLEKSSNNYLKGIINVCGMNIGVIEEELLFYNLKRKIL